MSIKLCPKYLTNRGGGVNIIYIDLYSQIIFYIYKYKQKMTLDAYKDLEPTVQSKEKLQVSNQDNLKKWINFDIKSWLKNDLIEDLSAPENSFEWSGKDTIFFIDWEKIPANKIFALWTDYKNYIKPSEYDKKWVSEYGIKSKNNVTTQAVIDSMSQEEIKNNIEVFKKILLLPEFSWGPVGVKNLVKHLWLIKFDEDGKINKSEFNMRYDDDRTWSNKQNLWSLLMRVVSNWNLVHIKFTSNGFVDWFLYPPISHWPVS